MLRILIRKMTHKLWNSEISRLLCQAYNRGIINSKQLHILAALFDPTQNHKVDRPWISKESEVNDDQV